MKDQAAAAKPAVDDKTAATTPVVDTAKPGTAAAQPPTQGSTSSAASPTAAQQSQTGTGGHTGTGSEGHASSPGQQAASPTAGTATSTAADSSSANVFSVPTGNTGSAAASPSVKLPDGLVRSSVSLQEAVDAVKATFTAANQAGVSSARISLSPESLGGIKISLSQTPDGLIARVATDHPEAAATLQQNAGDLKRSLEQSGMSLLRLDIGSSGQQLGSFAGSQGDGSSSGGRLSGDASDPAEEETTSTPTELTVELSSGSLVNVLA